MNCSEITDDLAEDLATIMLQHPAQLNDFTRVMRGELIDAFDAA